MPEVQSLLELQVADPSAGAPESQVMFDVATCQLPPLHVASTPHPYEQCSPGVAQLIVALGVAAGQPDGLPPSTPLAGDDEELHPIATAASRASDAARWSPGIGGVMKPFDSNVGASRVAGISAALLAAHLCRPGDDGRVSWKRPPGAGVARSNRTPKDPRSRRVGRTR